MAEETTTLDRAGLRRLAEAPFFESWVDFRDDRIAPARAILRRAVHKLLELGDEAPISAVLGVLRECIEAFNRWNDERPFIGTIEREDICAEFDRVAELTGLGDHPDLEDGTEWRDW